MTIDKRARKRLKYTKRSAAHACAGAIFGETQSLRKVIGMKELGAIGALIRALLSARRLGGDDAALRDARVSFIKRFSAVLASCALVRDDAEALAAAYAAHVLKTQTDPLWWHENARRLTEAWFIGRYAVQNGLIEDEADAPAAPVVMKSERETGQAQIFVERSIRRCDEGRILICCAPETDELRALGYAAREGRYARRVDECAGGIMQRAAEAGETLLAAGYTLTLPDEALRDMIAAGDYAPERRHWVRATGRADMLKLTYPHDPTLHRYVCMAGGRWNGRYVELPISCAGRLDDLIRLYGFCVTAEAERRIAAWKRALETAQVYRPRKRPQSELPRPEDMFRKMMARETEVPRDLMDDDE